MWQAGSSGLGTGALIGIIAGAVVVVGLLVFVVMKRGKGEKKVAIKAAA